MALPTTNLNGWTATLYAMPGTNPAALTAATMGTIPPAALATAPAGVTTIVSAVNAVPVENVPPWGFDAADFTVANAGSRYARKGTAQIAPKNMDLVLWHDPDDAVTTLLLGDCATGSVKRTYVVQVSDGGTNRFNFAFNAYANTYSFDYQPNAEGKIMIQLVPAGGGEFGISFS